MNTAIDAKHELLLNRVSGEESARLVMTLLTTARLVDEACSQMLSLHGLSEGRFAVLLAVEEKDGASPSWIAERLGVTRATVTGLVDGLEAKALVARAAGSTDRRSQSVSLTRSGAALLAELIPLYGSWLSHLAVGVADPAGARESLRQVQQNLLPTATAGTSSR